MAGVKGTTELVKAERPRYLTPFEEMEKWFADVLRRPYPLLTPTLWPELKHAEFETVMPTVDIFEEGNELVLKADMPGMEKKDIGINISDNFLTISGERKKEEKVEKGNYYRYERSHGSFFRRFELPAGIDTEKVKAHLENGILEVRLPKTEKAKSKIRRISVA
jgi:HSP20 family protein